VNEIIGFKLVGGEEILGRQQSSDTDAVVLSEARLVMRIMGPQGPGFMLTDFLMLNGRQEVVLRPEHIMFPILDIGKPVVDAYLQTVTGILLAGPRR
jgi:hypothetical protein